ncbi:MAG: hypothetical protein AAGE96_23840 [Cyanobacteria bacterium P01_G01_bin.19]
MMVSAFTHERGEILGIKVMENKKQSEIVAVQDLLQLLDLTRVVFTMDALHCQKADATPRRFPPQGNAHQAKQYQQLSAVTITI